MHRREHVALQEVQDNLGLKISSNAPTIAIAAPSLGEPNNVIPNPPLVPAFTQGKAIYLSGEIDRDPLCAVFNDGSLWCRGTTPTGTFAAETQIAPPGSLPRTCN